MQLLVTGATGLTGSLFLAQLATVKPGATVCCLVRSTSDRTPLEDLDLQLHYWVGDSSTGETWTSLLAQTCPETIVHIASIRHMPVLLERLQASGQRPRLIAVGTTGVYSQYNQYAAGYQHIEQQLVEYAGTYCLLRPTMIYGSQRDKNLHKLIAFCDRTQFFPVFGSGNCLIQPIHAEDLAQAMLSMLQDPQLHGAYDLSGGSVVTFRQLLTLVATLLDKPVRQISLPLTVGLWLASLLERVLGRKSPLRREQILRLQEDKAYCHTAAQRDFNFCPRSLETGLQQEIALLRAQQLISSTD